MFKVGNGRSYSLQKQTRLYFQDGFLRSDARSQDAKIQSVKEKKKKKKKMKMKMKMKMMMMMMMMMKMKMKMKMMMMMIHNKDEDQEKDESMAVLLNQHTAPGPSVHSP